MMDYEKLAIASPSERTKMVKQYIYATYKDKFVELKGITILDEYYSDSKHIQLDMDKVLTQLLSEDDKKLLEANQ